MTRFTRKFTVAGYLIALLLGLEAGTFLYAYFENAFQLKLNSQVSLGLDPLSLINLIVTILLAVYVLRKLEKRDRGEIIERDLLIRYITTFDTDFTEILRKEIAIDGVLLSRVNAILKRHGMRIKTILRLAVDQRFLDKDSASHLLIDNKIRDLRDLLTNTPREGAVEDGIRVTEGKLFFSETQTDRIVQAIFDINSLVFQLIVEINRAERDK